MRRREDRAIAPHTINLYEGDYAYLQDHYGTRIGAAKIIRDKVHEHVRELQRARPKFTIQLRAPSTIEGAPQ